jgi:YfiH family protein
LQKRDEDEMTLNPETHPLITREGIAHGFFGQRGGVSEGIFKSLNCGPGSNDNALSVIENRALIGLHFGVKSNALMSLHQVHSPHVIEVSDPWKGERPQGDAMVTRTPGLALSILTADCGPILFCDASARVIGAAHAGWKGAFGGVLEATIDAMVGLGATRENIYAVIGPTISGRSYEVGSGFYDQFVEAQDDNHRYFSPSSRPGHHYFDLPRFTGDRLGRAAIGGCANLDRCTYIEDEDYFSYRRTTHRDESDYGRNISVIMLEDG